MENPAPLTLRPLRLGELLDQAIRLYRRNFITFVGIVAMVYVPLMILQIASAALMTSSLDTLTSSPEQIFTTYAYWGGMLSSLVVAFLQFIFVQGIATGALTRAVADNYLGKPTSILGAYRGIGKSWLPLLGALLLVGLLSIAFVFWWIIIPCVGWVTGLGMLVVLLTAVSPMVAPVVVLEGQGVISSVRRAWSLVRRRFWPVLGYVFVLYLFSMLIVTGPSLIINAALAGTLGAFSDPTSGLILRTIVQSLVQLIAILIYYPLQMAAFTLIYFDLRVRTEGFDIALLTVDASDQANIDQVMAAPAAVTNERLIAGSDLGNFAILTLGAAGIYIFFISIIMGSVFLLPSLFR